MSIKDFNKQTVTNLTFDAATRPVAPTISGYAISGTDDTALDPAGGQTILVNGSGFRPGATITLNNQDVSVVSFVSVDQLSFTSPALSAGTYTLFVVNPDNGAGILTPGLIYSTFPTWTTSSGSQGSYYETTSINNSFVATSDTTITSYTLASGTLPPGSSLASNGVLTGTAPVDSGSTTYTFTLKATDSELQDSTRSFSLTINTDVVSWSSPSDGASYSLVGNQAMANVTLSASSAAGYAVSYTANALPTGVTLSSGTISGTPTVAEAVSTLLTATAATTNRSATRTISWTVSLGDIYWKNVSLLLSGSTPTTTFINDASLNNSQLTIAGDTKPNNFNPYSQGYYSTNMNGQVYSALSAAGSSFYLTGDFTMEAWVYQTSAPSGDWGILDTRVNGQTATPWVFAIEGTSRKLYLYDGSAKLGSTALATNTWYHLCWVRSGSVLRGFVNGVLEYYNASYGTSAIGQTSTSPYIGTKDYSLGGFGTYGYISNLRVVNGTAVYTTSDTTIGSTSFVPSTTPLTAVTNTVLLACQSPRFSDSSNNNFTISPSSSTLVTVSSAHPFATPTTVAYNTLYSTYFDGTGDYLSAPANTAFAFGTVDYTFELWVYSSIAWSGVICLYNNNSGGYFLQYNTGTGLQTGVAGSSATGTYATTLTANSWNHIAVSRASGSSKCFVNGTQVGTTVSDTTNYAQNGAYIGALYNGAQALKGYISNLRVVKGTAVYTSNFTPSTTPLTAVSGTSLLTCQNSTLIDNSTNAFAIASLGQAQPVAVSPFTMTTSSTTVTSLGSAYFDGTGDTIFAPASVVNTLSGTWTVEAWCYMAVAPTGNTYATSFPILSTQDSAGTTSGHYWGIGSTAFVCMDRTASTFDTITGTMPSANRWFHFATTNVGTTINVYIDGILVGTKTQSAGTWDTTLAPTRTAVGSLMVYNYASGYIADLRIIKGTALYTSNFLPPQAPLTSVTNTQLLTLQYNGGANNNGFVDQSSFNNIITRNGNPTQGTFSPFSQNGWSTYYNGSNSYQYVPTNTAFAIGTADFTVEAWVYPTTTNQQYSVIFAGISYGSSSDWGLYLNESTISSAMKPSFLFANGGSAFSSGTTVSVGAWTHIAVARQGTTVRFFINGALTATTTSNASLLNSMQKGIGGGFNGNGSTLLTGYISNLRVISGTAVYTSAFTPPTSPLTSTAGTILLTNQNNRWIDNSPNNFAITTGGTPSLQAYSPFGGVTSVPTSYSVYFDGTSDTYTINGNAGPIGTEDFTFETWAYISSWGGQYPRLIEGNAAGSFQVYFDNQVLSIPAGNGGSVLISYNVSALTNQWLHICVTRTGSALRLFINGVLRGYSASGNYNYASGSTPWRSMTEGGGLTGYVSNMRIVRGSVVSTYSTSSTTTGTTIFTPPASPLTAISGTQFLGMQSATMIDNSTNYFSITASGDVKPRTYNPFGTTNTTQVSYTPAVNGGSMYFDGTGDYLTQTTSTSTVYGLADFTVEYWVYITANNGSFQTHVGRATDSACFAFGTNGTPALYWTTSNVSSTGNTTLTLNQWYHVAWVRTSGTLKAYLNGVQDYTGSVAIDITTAGFGVGGQPSGTLYPFGGGYLSDIRVTKGKALYAANFYPNFAPATPTQTIGPTSYSSSLLLNGTSGGIIDSHSTNNLETIGNTQLAPQDPYSGTYYSNYSDGNADYLTVPSASWSTLAGTFTFEGWFKWDVAPAAGNMTGVYASGGWVLYNDGTRITPNIFGTGNIFNSTFLVSSVVLGQWYHIAVTRNSANLMTMWVNGVSVGSATTATTYTQGAWYIFSFNNTNCIQGNISNLRINNTCLYTTTFTPSTTPLTAVSGTQLLTCQSSRFEDNSTNAATLTPAGTVSVKSLNPFQQNTGKSLYFDGSGDRLMTGSGPANSLGSGDFTIEGWIYNSTLPSNARVLSQGSYTTGEHLFVIYSSGAADFCEATTARLSFPSSSFLIGQWQHFAIVRSGTGSNNLKGYIKGVSVATATSTYNYSAITNTYLGSNPNTGSQDFNGYIKDLRITKGVARYTTTFTPPITPLQNK